MVAKIFMSRKYVRKLCLHQIFDSYHEYHLHLIHMNVNDSVHAQFLGFTHIITIWPNENYITSERSKYIWYVTSCHQLTHFSQSKILYDCIFYVSLLNLYFQFIQRDKTPTRAISPMGWVFYPIGGVKRPFLWKNRKGYFLLNYW